MSLAVLPSFTGLGWSIGRTPEFKTRTLQSVSGKVTTLADWTYPIYRWDLTYNLLRQGVISGNTYSEMAALIGFYEQRQGGFDSFLYQDQDDNSGTSISCVQIAKQSLLPLAPNNWTFYQLLNNFGSYSTPIYSPAGGPNYFVDKSPPANINLADNTITVHLGDTAVLCYPGTTNNPNAPVDQFGNFGWLGSSGIYTVYVWGWGSSEIGYSLSGVVGVYSTGAPWSGTIPRVDMSYYWPCRFIDDSIKFEKFHQGQYMLKQLSFQSIK